MKKYILIILVLLNIQIFAQDKVFQGDPDRAFEVARNLAFNSQRKQAQDTLRFILTKYPDYHDIRSFLGTTYSWDGAYEKAKKELSYVLEKSPDRLDTWEAIIKNEMYKGAPFSAIEMTNKALTYFPDNESLLYLQASAEDAAGNKEKALLLLEKALDKYPDNVKISKYKESLLSNLRYNFLGIKSSVDLYSEVFDPMEYYLLKYVRQTKYGGIHLKYNFSRRFDSAGSQIEVDMYPRISPGFYAYMNIGYSTSYLYPDLRYGAELYKSLPKGFEVSLGFRALKYVETTNIFTGSIGWYTGNSYLSLRSYVTPGEPSASMSGTLSYRKYRQDAYNYFSAEVGMGFSPDIYRFDFENNENEIVNLDSQKLNFGYYFSSKNNKNYWGFTTGVSHQEISFNPGSYFWIYSFSLSYDFNFK